MFRCVPASCVVFVAASALSLGAQAQTTRQFTAQTLRGSLQIQAAPNVLLNGQPARLAPGSRIRGTDNLLVFPGSITGQALVVNYTVDGDGLIRDVWVLNEAELANKRWPTTPAQAAQWRFDFATQTWTPS